AGLAIGRRAVGVGRGRSTVLIDGGEARRLPIGEAVRALRERRGGGRRAGGRGVLGRGGGRHGGGGEGRGGGRGGRRGLVRLDDVRGRHRAGRRGRPSVLGPGWQVAEPGLLLRLLVRLGDVGIRKPLPREASPLRVRGADLAVAVAILSNVDAFFHG